MPQRSRHPIALTIATLALASCASAPPVVSAAATLQQSSTAADHATPEAQDRTESFELTYQKPSELVALITADPKGGRPIVPPGVGRLSPDDVAGTLTVRGSVAALDAMRSMVRLLDIAPQRVRLNARLLRGTATGGALQETTPVATFALETTNNYPGFATVVADGSLFRAMLTPHVNGDGTLSLAVLFTDKPQVEPQDLNPLLRAAVSATGRAESATGRAESGKSLWFLPDGFAGRTRRATETDGKITLPTGARAGTRYVLEVTPTSLPPGTARYARAAHAAPPPRGTGAAVPVLSDLPILGHLFSNSKPAVK